MFPLRLEGQLNVLMKSEERKQRSAKADADGEANGEGEQSLKTMTREVAMQRALVLLQVSPSQLVQCSSCASTRMTKGARIRPRTRGLRARIAAELADGLARPDWTRTGERFAAVIASVHLCRTSRSLR